MECLVVYDSMFGNTKQVAQAVANGLAEAHTVKVVNVGEVKPENLAGVSLLVAGSATQAFGALKPMAAWLDGLPAGSLQGKQVAAFDTRMEVKAAGSWVFTLLAGIFGYAAEKIDKKLVAHGGSRVSPPAGFIVNGKEGPLMDGELARAAAGGISLLKA